jgi:hypothetical protein
MSSLWNRQGDSRDYKVHQAVLEDQMSDARLSGGRRVKFVPRKAENDEIEAHRVNDCRREDPGVSVRDNAPTIGGPFGLHHDT